jgi:hypothetical protein
MPSNGSALYSSLSAPLDVQPNSTANYIIAIFNNHTLPITTNIMIKYKGDDVALLHNTPYKEVSK